MTQKQESGYIPSNEEIIEELTHDLHNADDVSDNPPNLDELSKDAKNASDLDDKLEKLELENDEESDCVSEKKKEDLLNDFVDEEKLKEIELSLSEEEKQTRKDDARVLKQKGNAEYKLGNFLESINVYTSALRLCPLEFTEERSILYSNRAASKIKLEYVESALEDCTKALELNADYVKTLIRRAKLYENKNDLDQALEDYKKLSSLDETNNEYKHCICALTQKIDKRNEEMKTEMLGNIIDSLFINLVTLIFAFFR